MRTRHLLGVIGVLLLILAIWLVPMALAAAGGSTTLDESAAASQPSGTQCPFLQTHPWLDPHGSAAASQPSGTQCPFLQTHPWLDPHGSDSGAGTSTGTSSEVVYY